MLSFWELFRGDWNSGSRNSGYQNSGNRNSGDRNNGNRNSGDRNSGDFNSGYLNSGSRNNGDRNSGHQNSGDLNSGNRNSGDRNSGDWNSGDWNSCNHSSGCFNTKEQPIVMFNKLSDWSFEDWMNSKAYGVLRQMPSDGLTWVSVDDMTEDEKEKHPESETTGGFLREEKIGAAERQIWWDKIRKADKAAVTSLPNFDATIFKKITGIKVEGRK